MAVYKIFPDKDTFIFTEVPNANAGYDEILELGGYPILGYGQAQRALLSFPQTEINRVLTTKVGAAPRSASLNLKLAEAYEVPVSFSVSAYPVYDYWDGGVGQFGDTPTDTSGCSWRYPKAGSETNWTLPYNSVMPAGVTGSYNSFYQGGGSWYYENAGTSLQGVQHFETNSPLDLDIDVTTAFNLQQAGTINNNGFILKLDDVYEFYQSASIKIKYYSANTHTIYPPTLDIKWDDSVYSTGSLNVLTTSDASITITNNKGEYPDYGKQRFRLSARPKNPVRTFTTGSIYKTNYALPSGSYWGLRDEFTEEMVIPFDQFATKVSCDGRGSFFDIYMEGLQPERYYRLLVQSDIDGNQIVVDGQNTFKVVRNG